MLKPYAVLLTLVPLAAPGQETGETSPPAARTEVVIVTAGKVAEDVFRVPMSIQVLPRDHFEVTDPADLYELQFDVPGLVVASIGMNGAGISLRGVTAEAGQSLAVAPHFNGVYLGRPMAALSRLFDVERVEVLKGPQGTLYGRNATGGSINVISRAPEDSFGSRIESAAGSFNTVRVDGNINFAPTERISVRLAGVGSEGDGFIRNTVDERTFGQEDYGAFRAAVRARPGDALTVNVTAQHMYDDGASNELWLPNRAFLPDPRDIRLTSVALADPYLWIENDIVSLDVAREFEAGTLNLISGYLRNLTRDVDDCSSIPGQECIRSYQPHAYEQRSQEVRFSSPAGDRRNWLVGAYFLDADELKNFRLSRLGTAPFTNTSSNQAERAAALFGQADFRLTQTMSFTAGLRASYETSDLTSTGTGMNDSPLPGSIENDYHNTSWRIGFEYAPAERVLYYASVATGFKSGGTAGRLASGEYDSFDPEELTAYEAGARYRSPGERWTLHGSAFFYDFEDLQVVTTTNIPGSPNILFSVDNASDALIEGIDLSADLIISERLTFQGALVWMPTREFVDFTSMATGVVLSGNVLSRAPEWTSSVAINYERPVKAIGNFSLRADYAYRSEHFFTKENVPANSQDAFGLLNLYARFDSSEHWYVFASARNLLDTDYFTQAFIQSSPGRPTSYEVGFGLLY